ncbi:hypothetical protein [Tsukamurella paurometabola]|nr:hypothetical protein [Tsukamurella paurometabola]
MLPSVDGVRHRQRKEVIEMAQDTDTISTPEFARRMGVARYTAWEWLRKGLVPGAYQVAPNHGFRIPASAVEEMKQRSTAA